MVVCSCSISAPVIRGHNWEITAVKDLKLNKTYESLSIFVNCYDDDGENDIETIFFIDDKSGLYWQIDSSNWEEKIIDDVRWLGYSTIVMADRSAIHRNPIRIYVRDLAGEFVEDKLYITKRKMDTDELLYPELITEIETDNLSVKNYEAVEAYLFIGGLSVATGQITTTPKSFKNIFGKQRTSFENDVEIFIIADDGDLKLKSGPWY
ncbi:MAG: hypothetical protein OCD02_07840 [Spirochaetaceae bacterium]